MADEKEINIPDLKKKKEEEKKKAGAAWTGAKPGSSPFSGATGGSGVARAAASAGRAAISAGVSSAGGAGTGFFAQIAALLGNLGATLIGKIAIAIVAAMMVAGAVAVVAILGGGGKTASDKSGDLGAIASSIKVERDGGSRALQFASNASRGLIRFGPAEASKKTETAKAPEQPKAAEAAPPAEAAPGAGQTGQVGEGRPTGETGRSFATKFGQLSGSTGGAFGKNDVFQQGPKYGEALGGKAGNFSKGIGSSSRGGRLAGTGARGSRSLSVGKHGMRSSKALAQLRGMGTMNRSMTASAPTMESAGSAATAQFEGARPAEAAPTSPADAAPSVAGAGGGTGSGAVTNPEAPSVPAGPAENCTESQLTEGCYSNGSTCMCMREVQPPSNETPWQGLVDAASVLMLIASALVVVGGILALISNSLFGSLCTAAAGAALRIVTLVILALGAALSLIAGIIGVVIGAQGGGMQGYGIAIAGGIQTTLALLAMAGAVSPATAMIGAAVAGLGTAMGMAMSKPPDLPPSSEVYDAGNSAPPAPGTPGAGQPQ